MTSPALEALRRLRRLGFQLFVILGEDGGSVELACYSRTERGAREVVVVYGEHRARAYRIRAIDAPDDPLRVDASAVDRVIPSDDVVSVVHALLSERPGSTDE